MTRTKPPNVSQPSFAARNVVERLAHIKIEDEDDTQVPFIDLSGLDDEQEGVGIIREATPIDRLPIGELPVGCEILKSADLDGEVVLPGDSLEFDDGHFLHNIRIFFDHTIGSVSVDGNNLMRNSHLPKNLQGMLSKKYANELCLVLRAPSAGKDATLAECRVLRHLEDAVRKRDIVLTNKPFPAYSVYEFPYHTSGSMPEIKRDAQLVCRWRCTEETINSGSKVTAGTLMTLREHECDEDVSTSDTYLLKLFLGQKQKQRPAKPRTHDEAIEADERVFVNLIDEDEDVIAISDPASKKRSHALMSKQIDLTSDGGEDVKITKRKITETIRRISSSGEYVTKKETNSKVVESTQKKSTTPNTSLSLRQSTVGRIFSGGGTPQHRDSQRAQKRHRFTFGDVCAGGGGVTSGAKQVGFKLNFLLDKWDEACKTLRLNFGSDHTQILCMEIYEFCRKEWTVEFVEVDVLHISFPCQPHSPLHTVEGKDDDKNIAAGYSVIPLLKICKPRIVTFEQTSGIVTHGDGDHFRGLICQITDSGYSLRWKICNLADHGNVQSRKRLIIIAACPGETLPPFPEPTHDVGPGRSQPVTVRDILHRLRHFQVPANMRYFTPIKDGQPYDSRKALQNCINCTGKNPHPNGKRTFTLFELAALQGFLPTHRFFGTATGIRKQIGNAVPSFFAKLLFQRISESLEESDRRLAAYKPEVVDLLDD